MVVEGAEEQETVLTIEKNKQKRKLYMDSVIRTSRPHKEYLALVEEGISLVGKSTGMLRPPQEISQLELLGLVK